MLKIGDNFDYQGKLPNFNRDTFETKALMRSYPETSIDEGHISLCQEDGKLYQFFSKNSVDPEIGKWRLTIDTALSTTSENSVQNKVISNKFKDQETLINKKLLEAGNQLKAIISSLEKLVKDNERTTSAALKDITTTFNSSVEVISSALQDLNLRKLDSDVEINGIELGNGNITLTKTDIGLGNVDNTSDAQKPISIATQTALGGKVDKVSGSRLMTNSEGDKLKELPTGSALQESLLLKVPKSTTINGFSLENNVEIQADDIKLSAGNDTTILIELGKKVPTTRKVAGKTLENDINLSSSDVGLGNVNNTADEDKPISTLQQQALDKKVDKVPGASLITEAEKKKLDAIPDSKEISDHLVNKANPHQVTKDQIGLGNVDNTADLDKPISNPTQQALGGKVDKIITVNGHALSSNITITKGDISLGNVDNTADLNKPVSKAVQTELDKKVDKTVTINSHPLSTNIVLNKADISLGNVDNTADLDKPISASQQQALDKKVDKTVTVNGHALNSNITITKGDIELGNVDNTSDINKPISTAQEIEFNNIKRIVSGSVKELENKIKEDSEITSIVLNEISTKLSNIQTLLVQNQGMIQTLMQRNELQQ